MTDPSEEAQVLTRRIRAVHAGHSTPLLKFEKAAAEIDTLTEQRVAAAVERIRQKTPDRARILVNAIIAEAADRPAPEGASPILCAECGQPGSLHGVGKYGEPVCPSLDDLARPRCSTPSQEDTVSVSGERWPDPTPEMRRTPEFEAVWQTIKTWDIGVPAVYGGYSRATGNHVRAILDALAPPTDAGGPGSASNTESSPTQTVAAPEGFQCPACRWHHGEDPKEWFAEEAKLRGFLEVVKRERVPFVLDEEVAESSPTQTVAPPGSTAGDVERADAVSRRWAEANYGPNAGPLLRLTEMIAGALSAARAELLSAVPRSPVYTATDTARWIINSFNLSPGILAPLRDELIRQFTDVSLHTERVARAELLAQIRELDQAAVGAIRFAHQWIAGLPISPSFEDKRAAQEALERAEIRFRILADKLTEARPAKGTPA